MKAKEHHLPLIAAAFGATLLLLVCFPTFAFSHLLCSLDASMGYLFVSEAEGTPWFSNTEFPSVSLDSVDKKLSNASFRLFARIFPGGREKFVSPYLGLGVGPALTQVEYEGKSTGRRESDSVIRVSYSVSVGSKLRFGSSPFSAFIEGSFGGLGALASSDEEKSVAVPQKGFDFVGVAAGLGVTFP
jgi:hypothetical protein